MAKYILTKSQIDDNCEQSTLVYGIAVMDDFGNIEYKIDDISVDYDSVAELVEVCNKEELSPIHFLDVVEDFLVRTN